MVAHTRLDCTLGGAAQMRQALSLAVHHCTHREAFGARLRDQPLMSNVLADLCVESEAATVLAFRVARAFQNAHHDEHERALARIGTAVAKYHVCKQGPRFAYESMECLGGNGYVEDSPSARLFRESPLNAIWEGSGNVISLDVLRVMHREPAALDALLTEVTQARGMHPNLDAHLSRVSEFVAQQQHTDADQLAASARLLSEQLALALQASLLLREASPTVAELFCRTRLDPHLCARNYGCLPAEMRTCFDEVVSAALPDDQE
jgi:putative acyl-CoA dehydrogenase